MTSKILKYEIEVGDNKILLRFIAKESITEASLSVNDAISIKNALEVVIDDITKKVEPGFDPNGTLSQDDYEFLTGTGIYSKDRKKDKE